MSAACPSSPGRRVRFLAVAALGAGLRCLADAPSAPGPAPAGPSIEAAKKDFSALKRPVTNLDDKTDLPRIDVPTIDPSLYTGLPMPESAKKASASSQKNAAQRGQKDGAKSADWLLRAMDKEAAREGSSGPAVDKDSLEKDPTGDQDVGIDEGIAATAKERAAETRKPDALAQAGNPLNAFMAQWISSQNQAILLPKDAGGAGEGGGPAPAEAPAAALPGGVGALPSIEDLASIAPSLGAPASDRPSANPYLAALEAPLAAAAAAAPAATPELDLAQAPGFRTGPEPQPAPSLSEQAAAAGIPDFARPSDADKYFPELKRF